MLVLGRSAGQSLRGTCPGGTFIITVHRIGSRQQKPPHRFATLQLEGDGVVFCAPELWLRKTPDWFLEIERERHQFVTGLLADGREFQIGVLEFRSWEGQKRHARLFYAGPDDVHILRTELASIRPEPVLARGGA